jgi:glycosyltransferase involved in cell wall biosynthesis
MRVPAIGTRIRGIEDLLRDGRGLLVPLGEAEPLTEAMRWISDHPEEAAAMGKRGREHVEATHAIAHILDRYEAFYDEMLLRGAGDFPGKRG